MTEDTRPPEDRLDVERLAVAAAARLEGEVSRLTSELAACSEAYAALAAPRPAPAEPPVADLRAEHWPLVKMSSLVCATDHEDWPCAALRDPASLALSLDAAPIDVDTETRHLRDQEAR